MFESVQVGMLELQQVMKKEDLEAIQAKAYEVNTKAQEIRESTNNQRLADLLEIIELETGKIIGSCDREGSSGKASRDRYLQTAEGALALAQQEFATHH